MKQSSKVTLQDIADKVNVTKGLVSLALNGKYGVSDKMRNKILLAAAELGYNINKTKYFLKNMKRTSLLVSGQELASQSFWHQIISGIESYAYDNDIVLNFINIEADEDSFEIVSNVLESDTSGVIALGDLSNDAVAKLWENTIHLVLIDSKHCFDSSIDQVRVNNFDGGYIAARYCVEKGHKDLLFLGDIRYARSFRERYDGFRAYLDEEAEWVTCRYAVSEGRDNSKGIFCVSELESRLDERLPSLIMCANDATAVMLYDILKVRGLSIPNDISVMSFDNSVDSDRLDPPLTGVEFSKTALGEEACRLLEARKKRSRDESVMILLPVQIKEKKSVRELK